MQPRCTLIHAVAVVAAAAAAALLLPPLAAGQPWPTCDTSAGTYKAGSAYESNLRDLAAALRAGAAASPSALFATGIRGGAPDAVYGLLLCRGDLSVSDCFDCGTRALVYNQCYARFSNKGDFLAATDNAGGETLLISGTNITGGAGVVAAYDRAVTELLAATVRYAVEENPARLFATGQRVGDDARDPGFRNIYSMAQCSPDLPPASCRRCLDGVLARWWQVFPLNGEGARVAGARCYLRSELGVGPFYTGAPMVVLRADKV
ncbi:hypothetical protein EE612_023134 [Oryza sativa]|nr:hypothetical protein EE612_023134 [Oryza sativa]